MDRWSMINHQKVHLASWRVGSLSWSNLWMFFSRYVLCRRFSSSPAPCLSFTFNEEDALISAFALSCISFLIQPCTTSANDRTVIPYENVSNCWKIPTYSTSGYRELYLFFFKGFVSSPKVRASPVCLHQRYIMCPFLSRKTKFNVSVRPQSTNILFSLEKNLLEKMSFWWCRHGVGSF